MDLLELFPVGQMMIRNEFINVPKIYFSVIKLIFSFCNFDKIGNNNIENVGFEKNSKICNTKYSLILLLLNLTFSLL